MLSIRIKEFIQRHLPQSPRIIVGLSGGADSMALLLSFRQAGCQPIAAHCNFHLRGEESERDRMFCESVCRELGIKLLIKDFDVTARRAETSESVEMACRTLRYAWWDELISSGVGDFIAVGHHCEDNVETLFLNLLRGSGIAGLKGMLPVNGHVIRPLLESTRAEIENYVTDCGFRWVTDSTNHENEYKRNRLRNIIIPILEQEFPGAVSSIVKSLGVLRENFNLYKSLVTSRYKAYVTTDGDIDIADLAGHESEARAILHEMLPTEGFTHSQIDDIYACATSKTAKASSGQIFVTPSGRYVYQRGILTKAGSQTDDERDIDITAPPFTMTRMSVQDFRESIQACPPDRNTIYLDASALNDSPRWSIRPWRKSDRLAPFGMKGSRLVSDLYTDAKYTLAQKQSTQLLFRNGELLWVIGLRASRHFKVTNSTTEVIKITAY